MKELGAIAVKMILYLLLVLECCCYFFAFMILNHPLPRTLLTASYLKMLNDSLK